MLAALVFLFVIREWIARARAQLTLIQAPKQLIREAAVSAGEPRALP
jgi:hypothetical protein